MVGRRESSINVWFPFMYVLPEMKLLFPKQNYNVLSPSSFTHRFRKYINRPQTDDVEIGTEAAQFPEKENINGIFLAVHGENL